MNGCFCQHLSANLQCNPTLSPPSPQNPNRAFLLPPTCPDPLSLSNPPLNHPGSEDKFAPPLHWCLAPTCPVSALTPTSGNISPPPVCFPHTPLFPHRLQDPSPPSPLAHFPDAPSRGWSLQDARMMCRPWPPRVPLPRSGSPGAPHPHRRSCSSSSPGRGRLPGSRCHRRAQRTRPRRTTRRRTGTEWLPTAPPWLREQRRERGEERCGTGDREGRENNPAAVSPKSPRLSYSEDRLRRTDWLSRAPREGGRATAQAHKGPRAGGGGGDGRLATTDAGRRRKNCPSALLRGSRAKSCSAQRQGPWRGGRRPSGTWRRGRGKTPSSARHCGRSWGGGPAA